MRFHESTNIDTPEGVGLELTLAGLGSRTVAQLVDLLLRAALFLALTIILGQSLSVLVWIAFAVVLFLGYEMMFETWWSGQTPGKRTTGIRVVRVDGSPVAFTGAAVRNILRLVDVLPVSYAIGALLIVTTRKHQRLGDLLAGTLVVREARSSTDASPVAFSDVPVPAGFDATMVPPDLVGLCRSFLARRDDLEHTSRYKLAETVALRLEPLIVDPSRSLHGEDLIEVVVAVKSGDYER